MHTVSGYIYTHNKMGAQAACFAFFDYLKKPSFNIDDYGPALNDLDFLRIEFTDVPIAMWERFCAVWIGDNAIYQNAVGCCVTMKRN